MIRGFHRRIAVHLFDRWRIGSASLRNRIAVSPMCQYSAVDGSAQPWHQVHYGMLAMSGAGLLCLEASARSFVELRRVGHTAHRHGPQRDGWKRINRRLPIERVHRHDR